MDSRSWGLGSQREYFYSQDGELDSIQRYRPEGSDLILTSRTHYERFPNELRELTTKYFSDGEVEYYETQNVIIDGIEKPSSAVEYKLNGADTIITYQSNTQYSNLYSERVYNFFWDHGSLHYGGKIESYFLDDNITQDSVLEYRLNLETGNHDPQYSTYYFYTDRLSSNSETHSNSDLIIFPNPTSDFIFIKNDIAPIYTPGKYYMIFDTKGQLIEEKELFDNQINISNLSNGNYFLKIENEAIKQFVVQH